MRISKVYLFVAMFIAILIIGSCKKQITIESVMVNGPGIEEAIIIDFFNIEDLTLTVIMSDETTYSIPLSLDMISAADLVKLSTVGTHQISISYLGFITTVSIQLIYDDLTATLRDIYMTASESDAIGDMTYEEWLDSIRGDDGIDGREIELRVSSDDGTGYIQWKYVGEESWSNLISLSTLIGESGSDGKNIEIQATEDYIQWRQIGDETWINLVDLSILMGAQGDTGVGIRSISINDLGELIIEYTDGSISNIGIIIPQEDTYQVVFRYDRRGAIYEYMTVIKDQIIQEPVSPVKPGYMFEGWYIDDILIDFPFTFNSNSSITLVAKWSEVQFDYSITSEEVIITGYNDLTPVEAIIPNEIEGYPVTEIANDAFRSFSGINSIFIPNSIRNIGDYAFYFCSALTKVEFEDNSSLESIGSYAFSSVSNLNSFDFGENSEIRTIGDYAFKSSGYLEMIEIPDKVISIGDYAFSQIGLLRHVAISENSELDTIGDYAFSNLGELNHIYIPQSVNHMGSRVFTSSNRLTVYIAHEEMPMSWASDWNDGSISTQWGIQFAGETEELRYVVTSNNKVTIVDNKLSFFDYLVVPEFIDEKPVSAIGDYAFNEVYITYLYLSNNIESIGKYAFSNISTLLKVTLGVDSKLSVVKERAFYNSSLYQIYLPLGVNTLGAYVFSNTPNLRIYTQHLTKPTGWDATWNPDVHSVTWGIKDYDVVDHIYYMIKPDDNLIITGSEIGAKSIIIPTQIESKNVSNIESDAFSFMGLISVIIPSSVTSMSDYVFRGNPYLSIYTQHNTTPIGWSANWNVSNRPIYYEILEYGVISDLHYIKKDINNIHIIGSESSASEVIIPNAVNEVPVTNISDNAFAYHKELSSIHIPSSIIRIGSGAFIYADKLTSVTFEANSQLTKIEANTFSNAISLESIIIPANIERIEHQAFHNSKLLQSIIFEEGSKLTYIGQSAFYGSAITTITIPNTVITIDNNAFYYNKLLNSVIFEANSQLQTIGQSAFSNAALELIIIPKSVVTIQEYAFMFNKTLSSVQFEDGTMISTIGTYAFAYNTSLEQIIIPASVVTMGSNVFTGSNNITIYARAYSRPSGWNELWNANEYPVVWGYID